MLSQKQLRAVQKVGEAFMIDRIEIYRKQAAAKDPANPWGDDDLTFATTPVVVKGKIEALVDASGFENNPGMMSPVNDYILRIPAGTEISPGDRVKAQGDPRLYRAMNEDFESTWQEWVTVRLRRIE